MEHGFLNTLGLNKRTFSSNFAPVFVVFLLSALTITPKFFVMKKYFMALWLVFFMFSIDNIIKSKGRLKKLWVVGVMFIIICVIYKLLGLSSAGLSYCIANPFLYFAPIIAFFWVDKCDKEHQIRFLFHFISLISAINIFDNIRLSYIYGMENVAYQQLAVTMDEESLSGLNFGGSIFVSMTVFYSCIMFLSLIKSRNVIERLLFFFYFGIGAYFVIMCSLKASAIILLLLTVSLIYVASRNGKGSTGRFYFVIALVGCVCYLFRDIIIDFLIDVIDSDRITSRLLIFTTEGDVTDSSTLMGRESLWKLSLESWLRSASSFFFGIGDHDSINAVSIEASGIGNHSDLFDVLARYGLLGGILLYSSIYLYYNYLKNRFTIFKWEIVSFVLLIVMMGVTKKIVAAEPAIMVFILFPLCLIYFSDNWLRSNQ